MKLSNIFRGDRTIWVIFLLLTIVSLVEVYSAIGLVAYSKFSATHTPTTLFFRHMCIVAASWVVVAVMSRVDYRYFSRFSVLALWVSVVFLILLLALRFTNHEVAQNGGRWIRLPIVGQFQPSEVAKVALVLFMARLMALKKKGIDELPTFIQLLIPLALVSAVVLPANFSTAALIFLSGYLMMYFGGVNRTWWWRLLLIGLVAVVAGLAITYYRYDRSMVTETAAVQTESLLDRSSTWGHRVHSWINPDTSISQENMARMAIASGGLLGVGPGNTVHARLMTQAHNDFIYAIILEEFGLVGGIVVFLLYALLYFRCMRIAWRCRGKFGALAVSGLGTMIFIQAVANMCVAVGVLPVTGQTLPFVSYGGTAYLFLALGLGVIQSIAAETYSDREEAPDSVPDDTCGTLRHDNTPQPATVEVLS